MDNGLFKLQESGVSMGLQIRRTRRYKRRAIANKQTKMNTMINLQTTNSCRSTFLSVLIVYSYFIFVFCYRTVKNFVYTKV
jgi:hypothetical protein